jgi:hypothetical protein
MSEEQFLSNKCLSMHKAVRLPSQRTVEGVSAIGKALMGEKNPF